MELLDTAMESSRPQYAEDMELVEDCLTSPHDQLDGAFRRIWLPLEHRLRALIANRLGGNDCDIDDAMQTAALHAFKSLLQYQGKSSLFTWLSHIVVNVAIDQRRARDCRPMDELSDLDTASIEDGERPEDAAMRDELRGQVEKALATLPDKYRLVLDMAHYRGLSYRDMKEELGMTHEGLTMLLYRARQRFKRAVEWYVA
jgi:RNA polymerase sigma-70 factor, ECF subfamily